MATNCAFEEGFIMTLIRIRISIRILEKAILLNDLLQMIDINSDSRIIAVNNSIIFWSFI